jgi:hypothetical protein
MITIPKGKPTPEKYDANRVVIFQAQFVVSGETPNGRRRA